jgi:hypothetical protein
MSKVPAHFELIPDIIALRDEISPHTLLTINGDIANREHGLQLVHQFPGLDGIMIGRGVFHDPYCFRSDTPLHLKTARQNFFEPSERPSPTEGSAFPAERTQESGNWRVRVPEGGDGSERGREDKLPILDLYSGVGTIGLTIGGDDVTLVEMNEHAVREMKQNIARLGKNAEAVLAASEQALDYITTDKTIIVDPPRAGLHTAVIEKLLEAKPPRIIYLSCNPVTQARDISLLAQIYGIRAHKGYNFFPRTPHIEHLVILDLRT